MSWEYEVADPDRVDEFFAAYESGGLSDDERFSLMETILESIRVLGEVEGRSPRWLHILELIENNIELHIYTVCYWACLGHSEEELELAFEPAPDMRAMLNRHSEQFGYPFPESVDEDT
ncbi:hypothetical protein IAD21_02039 [Abditibacteriota bacterium]|nr:hypothetical protein IAD21_02039 [Abditibacteriota bacterium]